MKRASGESASASGLSCQAATTSRAALAAVNRTTAAGLTSPAGSARPAVRGLAASIRRSTSRLNAIAALRAPTMATTIQATVRQGGHPPAARSIPRKANGSAKRVCSILIISSTVRRVRRGRGAGMAGGIVRRIGLLQREVQVVDPPPPLHRQQQAAAVEAAEDLAAEHLHRVDLLAVGAEDDVAR